MQGVVEVVGELGTVSPLDCSVPANLGVFFYQKCLIGSSIVVPGFETSSLVHSIFSLSACLKGIFCFISCNCPIWGKLPKLKGPFGIRLLVSSWISVL